MSVKVMSAVFDRYPNGGGEMLLALSLADHSHDDGTHIYPSVDSLALKTRQSVRSVQYQLKSMLESGWLWLINEGDGRRGQHREYRISPDWLKGAEFASLKSTPPIAPMGANDDIKGCNWLHPLYNRSKPPVNHHGAEAAPEGVIGKKKSSKGSRLPADWILPKPYGEYAVTEHGWTVEFTRKVGEVFKNYWIAKSGKDATKCDWLATWKNWCIKTADDLAVKQQQVASKVSGSYQAGDDAVVANAAKHGLKPRAGETAYALNKRLQEHLEEKANPKPKTAPPAVVVNSPGLQKIELDPAAKELAEAARNRAIASAKSLLRISGSTGASNE